MDDLVRRLLETRPLNVVGDIELHEQSAAAIEALQAEVAALKRVVAAADAMKGLYHHDCAPCPGNCEACCAEMEYDAARDALKEGE